MVCKERICEGEGRCFDSKPYLPDGRRIDRGSGIFSHSMMEVSRVEKFPQHHLLVSFLSAPSGLVFFRNTFSVLLLSLETESHFPALSHVRWNFLEWIGIGGQDDLPPPAGVILSSTAPERLRVGYQWLFVCLKESQSMT